MQLNGKRERERERERKREGGRREIKGTKNIHLFNSRIILYT